MTSTTMTTTAKNSNSGLRPIDKLLPLLSGVVEDGDRKWKAFCPIHEADGGSHDPSLHIEEAADGKLLLHCFPCGSDVKAPHFCMAVGLSQSDLYPDHARQFTGDRKSPKPGRKAAEYIYRDAQGCVAYRTERWEKGDGSKTFSQSRPNGEGGWVNGVRGVERVPYRLPELIAAPKDATVWIVEGEKKVEALVKWGLVATCNVGGAGKWTKEFSTRWLKGRDVIILPDNDPTDPTTGLCPGMDHARKVLEVTKPVAASVRILELPGLPPKGDIIDWIDAGGTLPQLLQLAEQLKGQPENQLIAKPAQTVITASAMDPLDLRIQDMRSDLGNGKRVIRKHGQFLRYCGPWKKWLVWGGTRWEIDSRGHVEARAKSVAIEMWDEFRVLGPDISEDMQGRIMNFVRISNGMEAVMRSLKAAASEDGCPIVPTDLDPDPWLLNCPNGTVDLQNGEIRPHRQEDMITKICPIEFNPDAECPAWIRFLYSIFDTQEMVDYIQRLCGYWATGIVREQSLPIFWGTGSNGKGTFLNAVMGVLGQDYAIKAPSDFLMVKRNDPHPTEKADLFGKRLVVCSETEEGRRLNESMVKELTGNEPIRARRMKEDFWQFDPTHKIIMVTNHLPQIRGTDHGIWRRIRRVPFQKRFWNPDAGETGPPELMQDKSLEDVLKTEFPGILAWIVRGCIAWHHDGEQAPDAVVGATNEYRAGEDLLGAFVEECCEMASPMDTPVSARDMYAAYQKWTKDNGEFCLPQKKFGEAMSERGFERFKSCGTKWYRGIKLVGNNF